MKFAPPRICGAVHLSIVGLLMACLTLVAIVFMFVSSDEPVIGFLRGSVVEPYLHYFPIGNSIVFNLSVGYLVSTFFWLLVVYFPERRARTIIRENLRRRYSEFRENTIQILLWAADCHVDQQVKSDLLDYKNFKEFFNENEKARWYAALNGLQQKHEWIDDLLLEMEFLATEVSYVLNKVDISDADQHSFFKTLREQIYRLKNSKVYSYDQVKYLGNFLWEIHARWSIVGGQRKNDIIEKMINAL